MPAPVYHSKTRKPVKCLKVYYVDRTSSLLCCASSIEVVNTYHYYAQVWLDWESRHSSMYRYWCWVWTVDAIILKLDFFNWVDNPLLACKTAYPLHVQRYRARWLILRYGFDSRLQQIAYICNGFNVLTCATGSTCRLEERKLIS